jgi:hypothetical protein
MICTKCSIDKQENEYYTYYHSTQKKQRTRKYCKSCYKDQKTKYRESITMKKIMSPVVLELEIEVFEPQPVEQINPFSTNPDYKLCRTCQVYKHRMDDYYHHGKSKKTTYLDCRKCCNERELNRRRYGRYEELETSGGSENVRNEVGVWVDEYQKKQTYMVMKALGYNYSDECGHFLKPGVKELIDGKLVFPNIKKKLIYTSSTNWNEEHRQEIKELYTTGEWTYKTLGIKYGVSTASIQKLLNKIKNEKESN